MVSHEPLDENCRPCLVCRKCHRYQVDYVICEMRSLKVTVHEVSNADAETLAFYLRPSGSA